MIVFHGLTDLALDTEYSVPADIGKTRPVPMSWFTDRSGAGSRLGLERLDRYELRGSASDRLGRRRAGSRIQGRLRRFASLLILPGPCLSLKFTLLHAFGEGLFFFAKRVRVF